MFLAELLLSETGLNNTVNVFLSFALKENLTSPEEFMDEMAIFFISTWCGQSCVWIFLYFFLQNLKTVL